MCVLIGLLLLMGIVQIVHAESRISSSDHPLGGMPCYYDVDDILMEEEVIYSFDLTLRLCLYRWREYVLLKIAAYFGSFPSNCKWRRSARSLVLRETV
jgi:hypothetical protein